MMVWPNNAQAALTLSFDDGYAETYEATATTLHERGLVATYSVITGCVGSMFEGLSTATWQQWQEAVSLGHEVASHSTRHIPLAGPSSDLRRAVSGLTRGPARLTYARQATGTLAALLGRRAPPSLFLPEQRSLTKAAEMAASRLEIEHQLPGYQVESFVYPAGRHSAVSHQMAGQIGFTSARTLDWNLNDPQVNRMALRAIAVGPGLGIDDLTVWLERALARRAWLIIVFHLVAERNPTGYPYFCSSSQFQGLVDRIDRLPFWFATQQQVVRHWANQLSRS